MSTKSLDDISPQGSPRWPNVRRSVFAGARASLQIFSVDPRYDIERYHEDNESEIRRSKQEVDGNRNTIYLTNPFDDTNTMEKTENPFADPKLPDPTPTPTPVPEPAYHIFNKRQKWFVVAIIGVAGLFSGLSSNIYFPALDAISKELNVSLSAVSLTITSYLIVQGITPVIWGSLADALGRRPIYIASFTVYIAANIALSFSPNFIILLVFRGVQAAGSASTVSIGNGVIQDISPPSERGSFISFYQAIRNFSIAVGPVLGGLLTASFGFRSVFVFLLILSSMVIISIILLLPETLRTIAGDGSLRLHGIYQPLIQRFRKEPEYVVDPVERIERKKLTLQTFISPLKLLAQKDVLINLIFGGVVYTIWSMVTSSTTGLFKSQFGLSEILIGLCYLPNGLGTIIGSGIVGKLMNKDFRDAEVAYNLAKGNPADQKLPAKNLPPDFPIENARLRNLPWIVGIFVFAIAVYGITLDIPALTSLRGWIVVPLVLQFLIAATSNAVFALNQTLISDLCPGKGASSTAINNLVRCGLAAVGVAFIDMMIASVGTTATFLGLALLTVSCVPLTVVHRYWGPKWRMARMTSEKH